MDKKLLKKTYEEYKVNRENPDRKFSEPNKFRKKIMHIIEDTKNATPLKGYAMDIMFHCITVEQHKDFLYRHIEESGNIVKTIENIDKAKARSVSEILVLDNNNFVELSVDKHGKEDKRRWDLIVTIKEQDLTLQCSVRYSKVKEFLNEDVKNVVEEYNGDNSFLGERFLNKQQYFMDTLKNSLNSLDKATIDLLKIKNK